VFVSIVVTLSIAATVTNHRRVARHGNEGGRFRKLLNIDMTTELPNRRAIEWKIEEEWDVALKTVGRPPLSLAVISIDDFDTLTAGARRAEMDEDVANFSRNLRLIVRRTDWLARISDREFAVLMIQTGKAAAMEAVQTLCDLAQSFNFASVGRKPTLSIGVATIRPNRGREAGELPDLADLALVQARRKGGNCIEWRGRTRASDPKVGTTFGKIRCSSYWRRSTFSPSREST
jgi:diguanylate cyclase (GGDEF)-like protein